MILFSNIVLFLIQLYLKKKCNVQMEESFDNLTSLLIYPLVASVSFYEIYNLDDTVFSHTSITENLVYFMCLRFFFHFFLCEKTEYKIHHFSFAVCLYYMTITKRLHYYAALSFLMEFTQIPLIFYLKTKKIIWGILLWLFFVMFRFGVIYFAIISHLKDSYKITFFENFLSKTIIAIMVLLNGYWFFLINKKIWKKCREARKLS